jgi:hypothetical protein
LSDPIKGTSNFAEEVAKRGPRDGKARSLHDFDLKRRLFAFPCSYIINSEAFDALPAPVKDYVMRRLWEILSGKDASREFVHLSTADRQAILEILRQTKPNLPEYRKPVRAGSDMPNSRPNAATLHTRYFMIRTSRLRLSRDALHRGGRPS